MCTYLDIIVHIAVSWRDSWFVALSFSHRSCGSRRPRRDISRPKKLHKIKRKEREKRHSTGPLHSLSWIQVLSAKSYNVQWLFDGALFQVLPNLFALFWAKTCPHYQHCKAAAWRSDPNEYLQQACWEEKGPDIFCKIWTANIAECIWGQRYIVEACWGSMIYCMCYVDNLSRDPLLVLPPTLSLWGL